MQTTTGANLGFEDKLWNAADKLRGTMDAAEYKHVVLGLIFLKYISDSFLEKFETLKAEAYADPEDQDEYSAENIFWVPPEARWPTIQRRAKDPKIGQLIDEAMAAIERDNCSLKGVLPKDYSRPALDKSRLGELIDLIATIVRAALVKTTGDEQGRTPDEMESAIRQLVSRAVTSTEVVDIFAAAGLDRPDISILSDEFLEEVKALPQRNLALELLKKLINDEIKIRGRKNIVQARSFAEMLEQAVRKYQNRAIESAEIIRELIRIARELREAGKRGESLGLNEDEVAFYDALAENGSAREIIGDEKLRFIAQEQLKKVRQSVSIDWTLRENARAQIRVMVKRILRQYGYPPDMEKKATELVLEQAEVLCREWVLG